MDINQEQLENLNPEQVKELQKQNCIFCQIVSGKVQSKKLFEDEKCSAILDINPCNPGHVLLLPKEHYSIMPQVSDADMAHLFLITKGISNAALRALKAQGTNIFVANGVAAGQKAPHLMINVIPRKDEDSIASFKLHKKEISEEEIKDAEEKIIKRVNLVMGIQTEDPINLDEAEIDDLAPIEEVEKEPEKKEVEEVKEEPEEELPEPKLPTKDELPEEKKEEEEIKEEPEKETPPLKEGDVDLDSIANVLLGR